MNAVPKPGEFYRHFKNRMYQIITVAKHSETGEKMVVYQALYGDYGVWVRPLAMFMEEVDRKKYPDAMQKYRFERVVPGQAQDDKIHTTVAAEIPGCGNCHGNGREDDEFDIILLDADEESGIDTEAGPPADREVLPVPDRTPVPAADREMHPYTRPGEAAVSPLLLEFLDAESFEERLAILQRMKGRAGQREVDSLCLCLDAKTSDGTIEEQLEDLKQYLRMQQRYDASRLRRG